MLKRTTAYTFIILAGLLFLAHAVVPHHHHDNHICFVKKHCANDNLKDDHGTNDKSHSHSHDGDNDSDHCILKAPVVLGFNQNRTDFHFNNISSDNSGHDGISYVIVDSTTELKIAVLSNLVFERSENCSFSSLVPDSSRLRAPPFV